MHRFFSLIVAGGLVLGAGASANAQVWIGNPFYGGYSFGGYGYPYGGAFGPRAFGAYTTPGFGVTTYNSGFSGFVAPGTTTFYSGTYGLYPSGGFYSPYYSGTGLGFAPSSVWMGVPRARSVWMGGGVGGWRRGWGWRRW